jgi:hypothetical protein
VLGRNCHLHHQASESELRANQARSRADVDMRETIIMTLVEQPEAHAFSGPRRQSKRKCLAFLTLLTKHRRQPIDPSEPFGQR